jgi:hypothetical protein
MSPSSAQVRDITYASLPTRKTVIGGGRNIPLVSVGAAPSRLQDSCQQSVDEDLLDERAPSGSEAIARITLARAAQASEQGVSEPRCVVLNPILTETVFVRCTCVLLSQDLAHGRPASDDAP